MLVLPVTDERHSRNNWYQSCSKAGYKCRFQVLYANQWDRRRIVMSGNQLCILEALLKEQCYKITIPRKHLRFRMLLEYQFHISCTQLDTVKHIHYYKR